MDLRPQKRSIIIEGADATGKSTLATELGKHYGIYVFRAGPKPTSARHDELCMLYQVEWLRKTSCIWDRFTGISNVCNLPGLSRHSTKMHAHYTKKAQLDAAVVICTTENLEEHTQEEYETDEDIKRVKIEHETVSNNYKRMAHDLPKVIRYDFKIRTLESLIEELDHAVSIRI